MVCILRKGKKMTNLLEADDVDCFTGENDEAGCDRP